MPNKPKKQIEIVARAIIQKNNKILVCKKIGKRYYFFPGGHVEFGEDAKKALAREIKEELGMNIKKATFIGGSEHLFTDDGIKHHEINLVYKTDVKELDIGSKENHLQFFLFDKNQLVKENILPKLLKQAILKWLKNNKFFWVSKI
jgi:ADP-ribose pyrophosphatase YjhB (NUDIX family)